MVPMPDPADGDDRLCIICGWVRYAPAGHSLERIPDRDWARRNGTLSDWDEEQYRPNTVGRRGHCLPCTSYLRQETPASYTHKSVTSNGRTRITPLCREHMRKKRSGILGLLVEVFENTEGV